MQSEKTAERPSVIYRNAINGMICGIGNLHLVTKQNVIFSTFNMGRRNMNHMFLPVLPFCTFAMGLQKKIFFLKISGLSVKN